MKKLLLLFVAVIFLFSLSADELDDLKVGLALSGGGARGFVHIGLLKVIDEIGLNIDYISGTSFGAVVGSMYALGYSAKEIESAFLDRDFMSVISDKVSRKDLYIEEKRWLDYGSASLKINKDLSINMPLSILSGNNILLFLTEYLSSSIYYDEFKDFPIPFKCVATNLITGESKEFSDGYLIDAVRSSMAFPSLLEPFEVDDNIYVDGGIRANLPVETLLGMGANYVIADKANSPLRTKENVKDLISVLDQTININMSLWVDEAVKKSDLVITPDITGYNTMSFDKIKELIEIGEDAARVHIEDLYKLVALQNDKLRYTKKRYSIPKSIRLNKIYVKGNEHLSSRKIRTLSGLVKGESYTLNEIIAGVKQCHNSKLFYWAYPKLVYKDGLYNLHILTKEKGKGYLNLDIIYSSSDDLVVGLSTTLDNYVQKNSKLIANLKMGGKNSFIIDYVKNFGSFYGGYYRIFPYIEEKKILNYDSENNSKLNRINNLQVGGNIGVGFFLRDILVGEGYFYSYRNYAYDDISAFETEYKDFNSTGLGVKLYGESIDDLYFPTKGCQYLIKYQYSFKDFLSDSEYKKVEANIFKSFYLNKHFSLNFSLETGYIYYDDDCAIYKSFEVGGLDSFTGYELSNIKSSAYHIPEVGVQYNFDKKFFVTLERQ
ncbi:MAG: hypothetical protein B6226_03395, partial [Candidatus Cloacimonetes bacterium 4572_65]